MKATGIYWLPETPADWEIAGAGLLFAESKKLAEHDAPVLTPSKEFGVVTRDEYSELSGHRPNQNFATVDQMLAVEPGHFIITMGSFESGLEYSRISGKITSHYRVLEASDRCDHGYYRWLFKSAPFIDGLSGLATEIRKGQEINYTKFSRLSLPLPPLGTQRRIAEYLDRETGQIDETITRIDRVVELLGERRQAVLDNTIAKARADNPIVKSQVLMKISSGEFIPRQRISDSGPFPVFGGNGIRGYAADSNTPAQSLVIGRVGALCGNVHLVEQDAWVSDNAMVVSTGDLVLPKWAYLNLRTMRLNDLASHTAQPLLSASAVGRQTLPVPPYDEQRRLVDLLHAENQKIDTMVSKSDRVKALLKERRSALITAAVTGRIEV